MRKTKEDKDKDDRKTSINFKLQDIKQSRYAISQFCTRQLQREHIRFKQSYVSEFPNDFICHILINYLSYAREHFKERLEKNVLDLMSTNQSDNTLAEKAFTKGILSLTNDLKNELSFFQFNNQMVKNNQRFFKSNKFFSYILEQFARMTMPKREIIYFYKQYKEIIKNTDRNEKQKILRISFNGGKVFEMKPYICEMDENTFSYYLMGYSRAYGSNENFQCRSIKLSRITECSSTGEAFSLSPKEKHRIQKLYEKFGAAYIHPKLDPFSIKTTEVFMTEKGYNDFLVKFSYQRPIPIEEPSEVKASELSKKAKEDFKIGSETDNAGKKFFKLKFDCSHNQLINYFSYFYNYFNFFEKKEEKKLEVSFDLCFADDN